MIPLDNRTDDLWRGGPWEQPDPGFPSPPDVRIPLRAMRPPRPVLRSKRRRRRWLRAAGFACLALTASLLALFLIRQRPFFPRYQPPAGFGESTPHHQQEYSTDPPTIPQADTGTGVTLSLAPPGGEALAFDQIYERNAPSIVSIQARSSDGYSTGTGIIMTQDGYLLTNAHVVAGANLVQVAFYDNNVLEAALVGFSADEDLAVLKVEAQGLSPAEFGDSAALRCGEPVAALGDPLGYRSTITDGIVSALDREVEVDGVTMVLIQTSAAINFGNSGGALINQYGQVVGVTTVKIIADDGSAEALGFAIPTQRVKYVTDALIDGRQVRTAAFGISVRTFPVEGGGLEILKVERGSDAWDKGLRPGDILTAANGLPVTSTQDLTRLKLSLGPGDLVLLTYLRDGVSHTVEVALVDAALVY